MAVQDGQARHLSCRSQPGDWDYTQGTELRDPSGKELGDYYGRLVSWYVNGGFTDENGVRHESGYHYKFPVWEVLNEVESEHSTTPEQYTERYDAIVEAIHRVSPETKFMGMALGAPSDHPEFVEYFLNPANHKPGIPLDFISYHFYAVPHPSQTIADWQYTFFDQADGFLNTVRYIENIRKRLSPQTKTDTDELGVILPTDNSHRRQSASAAGLLEPGRLALRLSLHRALAAADRHHRRVAIGRLSHAVSQREHDELGQQQAQRALLGAQAAQGFLPSRRQTGGNLHRLRRPGRAGLPHCQPAASCCWSTSAIAPSMCRCRMRARPAR